MPDHATIARFVCRHEAALAGLFSEVLRLCDQAGLVGGDLIAVDGTRLSGNASQASSRDFGEIARELLAEHKATDEAEDEQHGEARGGELPEQLRTPEGRREFFRQARREVRREEQVEVPEASEEPRVGIAEEVPLELEAENIVGRGRQGPDACLREGKSQLDQHQWENPEAVKRSRGERLVQAGERLESDLSVQRRAN